MPKIKTRKSAAKRVRMNAAGRPKRGQAFGSHLLSGKNAKRKRRLRRNATLTSGEKRQMKRLLPYA